MAKKVGPQAEGEQARCTNELMKLFGVLITHCARKDWKRVEQTAIEMQALAGKVARYLDRNDGPSGEGKPPPEDDKSI